LIYKVKSDIRSVVSACLRPTDYTVHGILQTRILEWVAVPFSRGSPQPRDQTQVSCIASGFLPPEPQGKPKNTGVGSLSLRQQIFPIQGLNRGLLHCRWILLPIELSGKQCCVKFCCSTKWLSYTHTHTHTHTCTHTCVCVCMCFILFSITVYHGILNIISCIYSRTLYILSILVCIWSSQIPNPSLPQLHPS